NSDAIFAFKLIKNLASPATNAAFVIGQRLVAYFDCAIVLFLGQSENWLPRLQHLVSEQFAIGKVQHWVQILDVVLAEGIVLFGECRLYRFRRRGYRWTGISADDLDQRRSEDVVHWEEDYIQRLLAMLFLDQIVNVRNADLGREAGVDSAAAPAPPG